MDVPADQQVDNVVYLRGLTIDGNFLDTRYVIGIALNSSASFEIQDCHIQKVTQGITVRPSATKNVVTRFSISNTTINKTQDGIFIAPNNSPTVGSPQLIGTLDRVTSDQNANGMSIFGPPNGFQVRLSVANSSFINNSQNGIEFRQFGNDSAGQKVWVNLHKDQIYGNAGNGIHFAQWSPGPMTKFLQVSLSDSLIVNNLTGMRWDNIGAVVYSSGDNVIRNINDNYLGGTLDRFSKQ